MKKDYKIRKNITLDSKTIEMIKKLAEYYGNNDSAAIAMAVKTDYYEKIENKVTSKDIKKIISYFRNQL